MYSMYVYHFTFLYETLYKSYKTLESVFSVFMQMMGMSFDCGNAPH